MNFQHPKTCTYPVNDGLLTSHDLMSFPKSMQTKRKSAIFLHQ
uniref:Uncharacterized protein n=1 Tax=Anguilla anguilla TaxID=7936 RepID=A0A0E9VBA1_ANGAN